MEIVNLLVHKIFKSRKGASRKFSNTGPLSSNYAPGLSDSKPCLATFGIVGPKKKFAEVANHEIGLVNFQQNRC
jgi:hypothetical protein